MRRSCVEKRAAAPSQGYERPDGPPRRRRATVKYLMLKHYRGGPTPAVDSPPMDQWTPAEVAAPMTYMSDFAKRLVETGEFVNSQPLSAEGAFVRHDGE